MIVRFVESQYRDCLLAALFALGKSPDVARLQMRPAHVMSAGGPLFAN